jgi:hypothetical protein
VALTGGAVAPALGSILKLMLEIRSEPAPTNSADAMNGVTPVTGTLRSVDFVVRQ